MGDPADDDVVVSFRRQLEGGHRSFAGLRLPPGADLRGLALSGCDFAAATLRGVLLDDALLDGCSFIEASLRRASVQRANLVGADLRGADLRGADLRGANLTRASLAQADLTACDARGATLEGTAISLDCRTFAGVALGGLAIRQLYSLILLARPDDPEVARQLDRLRDALTVALDMPARPGESESSG